MNLTNEQINLISTYWRKWQTVASDRAPVDRQATTRAIQLLYKQADFHEPEVIFVANPYPYYAQAFLDSMPDDLKVEFQLVLASNPDNIFSEEYGDNIAQVLAQQLLLPVECLAAKYLRATLSKVRSGKNLVTARREAEAEIYSEEIKVLLKSIAQVDIQFANQFGAFKEKNRLYVRQDSSWMGDIYAALYSNLKIPKVLIAEVVDRGVHDFSGIEVGCLDRVVLGFACARFDCLRDILDCEVGLNQEVIQSLVWSGVSMFFPYQKTCLVCESLDIKNM
jgi:hypothetical protein